MQGTAMQECTLLTRCNQILDGLRKGTEMAEEVAGSMPGESIEKSPEPGSKLGEVEFALSKIAQRTEDLIGYVRDIHKRV